MSVKQKFSFIVALGIVVGGALAWFHENNPRRKVASVEEPQLAAPKVNLWAHNPMGKAHKIAHIRVENTSGLPESSDKDVTLKAQIFLNQPVQGDLAYQWILPPGVHLVAGSASDVLPGIQSGEVATVEITVQGLSQEDTQKAVVLQVHGVAHGVKLTADGSYSLLVDTKQE
ncbi:MAG: hypothetical protein LW875_03125 [Proteobacteria bacterium]|jgi:hypothetical protein|nr:hypothetical protein [Pseudomonadota bacterium]